MAEDAELLRRYVDHRDEAAFTNLVGRHVNGVYSSALRRVGGDAHLAEDIVQQVFAALARKAGRLLDHGARAFRPSSTFRHAMKHRSVILLLLGLAGLASVTAWSSRVRAKKLHSEEVRLAAEGVELKRSIREASERRGLLATTGTRRPSPASANPPLQPRRRFRPLRRRRPLIGLK
jgi:hypothetical protein